MRILGALYILFFSNLLIADVVSSEYSLVEVQVRSGDYYAPSWNEGVTLLVSPKISVSGCNADRAYFDANVDQGMLSVALSAHAQGKLVNLLLNPDASKDTLCKIELISIK